MSYPERLEPTPRLQEEVEVVLRARQSHDLSDSEAHQELLRIYWRNQNPTNVRNHLLGVAGKFFYDYDMTIAQGQQDWLAALPNNERGEE